MRNTFPLLVLCFLLVITGCSKKEEPPVQVPDKAPAQAPKVEIADALKAETWKKHFKEDILPFWTSAEALGKPVGNFPTYRGMDGRILGDEEYRNDLTWRYPRMIARQVFTYCAGYLLTGDASLLPLAKKGNDWLIQYAQDKKNGGWFGVLDSQGTPFSGKEKFAQDTAYVAMAFGAYYFVTRDRDIEKHLLGIRDLIFTRYWDEINQRVIDGLSFDMKTEVDLEKDGGWELVAQLDQINAYMMLAQPVLTEETRRGQFLGDMKLLADVMIKHFWQDGIFWGVHTNKGKYDTRHVDYGHTLKSYWMLHQLDKRLPGRPYAKLVKEHAPGWLKLAFDTGHGLWGDKMLQGEDGKLYSKWGPLWWTYAELDQVAATFNFDGGAYTGILSRTGAGWLKYFVDPEGGDVYFSIKADGAKGYDWKSDDYMKCFHWKNGFHGAEHALVMYIHGCVLEKKPVELYFAVPRAEVKTFIPRPYIFDGKEVARVEGNEVVIDNKTYVSTKVSFKDIR